jgi:endonuclease YncB( thermonuclease family)
MNKFLAVFLLLLAAPLLAEEYKDSLQRNYLLLPIIQVYDGDTIFTELRALPVPLNRVSVRMLGIDAPEIPASSFHETGKLSRAMCIKEAIKGLDAKKYVEDLTAGHNVIQVRNFKWDKYGGRILGDVYVGGVNIAESLLKEGLVVEYDGGTRVRQWCD